MVEKRLAIIPARGGSKRLPGKNIMDFQGKPMIAWTIEAALETNLFDEVLVSTDDNEIAEISIHYGAIVPFLREEHADDYSTVSQATCAALYQMEKYSGREYQIIVQLMANCPLRSASSIRHQCDAFEKSNKSNSLLSGIKYGMFNPWWAHKKSETGKYERIFEGMKVNTRSQDLPELICPTGATWISSRAKLTSFKSFYSEGYEFFELNWREGVDIDDQADLELAKVAFQLIYENRK